MKNHLYTFVICFSYLVLTSFSNKPKPHLIVGNWQLIENQKNQQIFIKDEIYFSIERISFSSDEITSGFSILKIGENDEEELTLGFKIFEPFDDFKNPVILLKNLCDGKTRIVFSIIKLDKEVLQLKFEKEFSSENITIKKEILDFYRTAGPPENMS